LKASFEADNALNNTGVITASTGADGAGIDPAAKSADTETPDSLSYYGGLCGMVLRAAGMQRADPTTLTASHISLTGRDTQSKK